MRVLTESARYTQDLDFDHDPHRSLASLQKTVRSAIERTLQGSGLFGGDAELTRRVSEKLDLMSWALFRDQVLPALPRETQANIDEEEYLAMKVRLIESLEQCLLKHAVTKAQP